MKDAVAIHLVTTEKRGERTLHSAVEKFETITAARTEMRTYLRGWVEAGWDRVPRQPGAPRKPPMTMAVEADGETITCTIVVTKGPRRKLITEPNLSE